MLTGVEALALLEALGAPAHLRRHGAIVQSVADEVIEALAAVSVPLERRLVLAGAALHDAGKCLYPEELHGPGDRHEAAGQRLLLERGVDAAIAEMCVSHAQWDRESPPLSIEALAVALSDKLWKGKRVEALERRVIERAAVMTGGEFWDVFTLLDGAFEAIADRGSDRLRNSIVPEHGP